MIMKPQTIIRVYNIFRLVVVLACLISLIIFASKTQAQNIHGILRGKYEYQPEMEASRFEVRNARLSVDGSLKQVAAYKLEVDLCDESAIKMKDAWVRLNPWKTFRACVR